MNEGFLPLFEKISADVGWRVKIRETHLPLAELRDAFITA